MKSKPTPPTLCKKSSAICKKLHSYAGLIVEECVKLKYALIESGAIKCDDDYYDVACNEGLRMALLVTLVLVYIVNCTYLCYFSVPN